MIASAVKKAEMSFTQSRVLLKDYMPTHSSALPAAVMKPV
jgi:hypothetical protein